MMQSILIKARQFVKKETVFVIAAGCAAFSMFLHPPGPEYLGYIDFSVLSLLFCLMAVVAGGRRLGLFEVLAQRLLSGAHTFRYLYFILVMLPFFTSMLITNDVALIAFVPFAILVLRLTGQGKWIAFVVAAQTVAANLGSMATPFGNPQNLYLYGYFSLSPLAFFRLMLPAVMFSFFLLFLTGCFVPATGIQVSFGLEVGLGDRRRLLLFGVLFVLCILTVFGVIPYPVTLASVILSLLLADRVIFKLVDYWLLATFVCFFVFSGNIGALHMVRDFLKSLLEGRVMLVSLLVSQVISNVPAAVLLTPFTTDAGGLLLGTNLGGLGTLVASLASLISFKLYAVQEDARPMRYLGLFTAVNLAMLFALLLFVWIVPLPAIL